MERAILPMAIDEQRMPIATGGVLE
jgi:hypothetical protein